MLPNFDPCPKYFFSQVKLNVITTWLTWLFFSTEKNYYLPGLWSFRESGGKGFSCPIEPVVFLRNQLHALSLPTLTLHQLYPLHPAPQDPLCWTPSANLEVTRCSRGYNRNKWHLLTRTENCVSLHMLRLIVSFFNSLKLASLSQCSLLNASHDLPEILKCESGPQTQNC